MGWQHIEIPSGQSRLFCNAYISGKSAMNIVVTHTPIVTTLVMQQAYQPFEQYGVNIFAFDFSGTGKSGGAKSEFSRKSVIRDLDSVIDYIKNRYSSNIHLFGNTGIGGIFAQCYAAKSDKIKSFAQFACVHYKNTALIGCPYPLVKALCFLLKLLPNTRVTMKVPKYQGYNHEKDNAFYERMEAENPDALKTSSKMLLALLECLVAKDSEAKTGVAVPTLVFKTLHDRYYPRQYFDDYFESLTCEKKLVEVNDVHNSYYLESDLFCANAYEWFKAHS